MDDAQTESGAKLSRQLTVAKQDGKFLTLGDLAEFIKEARDNGVPDTAELKGAMGMSHTYLAVEW